MPIHVQHLRCAGNQKKKGQTRKKKKMRATLNSALSEEHVIFQGRRIVTVDNEQLEAVRFMARADPPVCGALDILANSIQLEELGLDGIIMDAPKSFTTHVLPRFAEFAREMQYQLTVQGFGVYTIVRVSVNCSRDAFFVEKHGASRRELVRKKKLDPFKEYDVDFFIPVAAAEGTYRVVCVEDDARQCRVVALPMVTAFPANMMMPMSPSSSQEQQQQRHEAFQVLHGCARELPSLVDGKLRSRIASLLPDYTRLDLLKELAMRAAYTRSHPPVILRHEDKERDTMDMMLDEEFADGLITNKTQTNKRRRVNFAATQAVEARSRLKHEQLANIQRAASANASTPISAMRNSRERALVHPIADSVVLLAEGTEVGAQPVMPEAPMDVPFFVQNRVADVARVFGIPQALLAGKGEKNRGDSNSVSTGDDKHNFARTIKGQYRELMESLREVYMCIHGDDGYNAVFSAPLHISVDIQTLMTLYEIRAIDAEDLTEEAVRMVGLDHRMKMTTRGRGRGRSTATTTVTPRPAAVRSLKPEPQESR